MRHRKRGRKLNRNASHRRAMKRNLLSSFFKQFGTDREYILTTRAKAKEYAPQAEKFITLAKKSLSAYQAAGQKAGLHGNDLDEAWKGHRARLREAKRKRKAEKTGKEYRAKDLDINESLADRFKGLDDDTRADVDKLLNKALHYRRLAASRLQDEDMVKKLFELIAPAYAERKGGYTRVLKTNVVRLGDGAYKAMLAFSPYAGQDQNSSSDED